MKKIYLVRTYRYDFFMRGDKAEFHEFDRMLDAWNFYKAEKPHEFDYGDSCYYVDTPWGRWENKVEQTGKHRFVERKHKETKPVKDWWVDTETIEYIEQLWEHINCLREEELLC